MDGRILYVGFLIQLMTLSICAVKFGKIRESFLLVLKSIQERKGDHAHK